MASQLLNLNDETLKTWLQEKKGPLLVAFWAPWSGPCTVLEAALKEIASDYNKRLTVARLNVDENAHAPAEYGVKSIPHILIFEQGKVVATIAGPQPKVKIVEAVERRLSS
ncbi:thioredoxin family protein [Oligoflexus tunisiensis]|uniref:thioredoxin family protein n=1 Tax=Oligoflexus tunisiensis TaxID=708132 RepID=UPI00114C8A05|nr:thioredoxin domain-containing protein [Oligoflexus tunisiensis]